MPKTLRFASLALIGALGVGFAATTVTAAGTGRPHQASVVVADQTPMTCLICWS